jgi:hypothetical protein
VIVHRRLFTLTLLTSPLELLHVLMARWLARDAAGNFGLR